MIYVFLADGFEEIEAIAPVDILRRAGAEVKTVGVNSSHITATHGVEFVTDITADEVELNEKLEMVVLPGGMPGANNLENSEVVQSAIDYCAKYEKFLGAICAAPKILGHKGLLKGKKATCFPGFESELYGADLKADTVVADGKFITAKGAGAAIDFGLKLVEALYGKNTSEKLRTSMQCK